MNKWVGLTANNIIRALGFRSIALPTGFVTPELFDPSAGTGNDDTAAFNLAIADGRPILLSFQKTYHIDGVVVTTASLCPGIFSLGGQARIVPAASATSSSRLLRVEKDDFMLSNLFFDCPISTSPTSPPIGNLSVWFSASSTISRVWVDNCRFRGGSGGLNCSGDFYSVFVSNCLFESNWSASSTVNSAHYVSYIGNQFITCGYSDGTGAGAGFAGTLRLGSSVQAFTAELYEVIGNTFKDCGVAARVEALDLAGNAAKNVVIANNNCSGCGNGFVEIKGGTAGATSGDNVYRRFLLSGNNIELRSAGGIGFNLHLTANDVTSGKHAQVLIVGNQVSLDAMPASSTGTYGAVISGWDDVTIAANSFSRLGRGIEVDGYPTDTDTVSRITVIGNSFYCYATAVYTATSGSLTSIIDHLSIIGNRIRTVAYAMNFAAATASATNLTVIGNYIVSEADYGIDLRTVASAVFYDNYFSTSKSCIICQGTTPGTITIKRNLLKSSTDNSLTLSTGTAITVVGNDVEVISSKRTFSTGATITASWNWRDAVSADPSGAYAMSAGDVFPSSAFAAGGASLWACTTASATAASTVAKALNLAA